MGRRDFTPGHDRGRVLVDVATMLVAGGEAIADIDTLRHQDQVLGPVASPATVWRALDQLADPPAKRVAAARAKTRARVWELMPDGLPAARVADTLLPTDLVVLDVDATIVLAHSEKEHAARTFKKTFGYHPLGVWCDNTGELLAARLRPGNAGSNTAADHKQALTEAIAQIAVRVVGPLASHSSMSC
ncbi:MAG: transposase [Tetrasphaera sp.]